jgi:N-acetylneuraminate synthase
MKDIFEKSLVASEGLPVGTELKREHLAFKKPGDGIKAADYPQWLGRRLARAVSANTKLKPNDFV